MSYFITLELQPGPRTTSQEIIQRTTMSRRCGFPKTAGTPRDGRTKDATKINDANESCPHSNDITATQEGAVVTMTCGCGRVATFKIGGACASYIEALEHFNDEHRRICACAACE